VKPTFQRRLAWILPAALHALKLILGLLILWALSQRLRVDASWAYISLIVVGSEGSDTWTAFLTRILNTFIGCGVGLAVLMALQPSIWSLCLAVAIVVFICSAFLGAPARWKIAPITTIIVMSTAILERSRTVGLESGVRRIVAVVAGSALAVILSMGFARIERWPRRLGGSAP
jgi:uncharacterized membrane protein YccC